MSELPTAGSSARKRSARLGLRCVAVAALALGACRSDPPAPSPPTELVGRKDDGRTVTPVNQTLSPYGRFVDLPGLRPQALAATRDG
ncbi:MAG: hypothetical protein IT457_16150, partial [Planctomycetes bacterium]|nr:hypothetical protein [Planctomycetota bacterium]